MASSSAGILVDDKGIIIKRRNGCGMIQEGRTLGFYLCDYDVFDVERTQTGIDRKIISQIACFNRAGLNCTFIHADYPSNKVVKGIGSLPGFPDFVRWPQVEDLAGSAFLYIRRPIFMSREFVHFLKLFKSENPKAVVMLELPTFPYDAELSAPSLYFALRKDKKYRKQISSYVDYVAIPDESVKEAFGISAVPFYNGIDLDAVSTRKGSYVQGGAIHIAFAASFASYHGCDLLIRGLAEYYQNDGERDIVLHLAGNSPLLPEIKELVKYEGLSEHVVLHGMLDRRNLSNLYDRCALAVGCLALHRRAPHCIDSSLKTREYLAKGLPFFYAGDVDVLMKYPTDFCLQFESTETPIDFNRVVAFYDDLYSRYSENELIARIRTYAEAHVSMDKAMRNVVDVLRSASA